ncbi:MAG TPA: HEPN domain-containing protein [Bdellovibrionota bacterium]|nr:HEPN domain-containing protein [Bdellovibrionota bacterium]
MSLKKCFETGQLKKIPADLSLGKKSLQRGLLILDEIPRLKEADFLEVAEQRLYQAFFHMIKALLYKDGVKEHSHYCTILYVKENYGKILESELSTMETLKDLRNQSQYGVESPSLDKEEIVLWLKIGKSLCHRIKKLLI